MAQQTTFSEEGFFSGEVETQARLFRDGNIQYFALYRRIAHLGYKVIANLQNDASDIRKGLITCLTIRVLSLHDAIRLCAEKGMEFEARVLLRSQLEATYTVLACEKDEEFHKHFIRASTKERHKLLTRLLQSNVPTENTKSDLEKRAEELHSKIKASPISKLTTKDIASKAGMEKSYNLAYSFYSSTVHANPISLQEYIVADPKIGIKEIIWGPQHRHGRSGLLSGMHTTLLCLIGATKILNSDFENELRGMLGQWSKLNSKDKRFQKESRLIAPRS